MSSITRWTVRTYPRDCKEAFWFYVYVYETPEDLRAASSRYRQNEGMKYFQDAVGTFQPHCAVRYPRKTKKNPNPKPIRTSSTTFIGVMRLCRPHMQQFVIIHESVHAALALCSAKANHDGHPEIDFDDIECEEMLAHAVHDISRALLYKARQRA